MAQRGSGWRPSASQVKRIKTLRGQKPPVAWRKIAGVDGRPGLIEDIPVTGEQLRTIMRDEFDMDTGDGRLTHERYIPWKPLSFHQQGIVYDALKRYSTHMQSRELPDKERELLLDWMAWMDGNNEAGVPLAVSYTRSEGFFYQPRMPDDRDYIHPPGSLVAIH